MIGVLIPTLDYAIYARLVGAANDRFSAAGISTLMATFDYDRGAEALVLVGEHHRPKLHELLEQFSVPFVNIYVFDPKSACPTVGFDNAMAAAGLTRHLVHIGHKTIAVLSGITIERQNGWRGAGKNF